MIVLSLYFSAAFDSHEQMDDRVILVDESVEGDGWLLVLTAHADQALVPRRKFPHQLNKLLHVTHC